MITEGTAFNIQTGVLFAPEKSSLASAFPSHRYLVLSDLNQVTLKDLSYGIDMLILPDSNLRVVKLEDAFFDDDTGKLRLLSENFYEAWDCSISI